MVLRDLTDKKAVVKAIEEFNALGRAKFLKKYGFDKSHSYFIVRGESHYDCKAIIGAAYGYQHPQNGPLRKQELKSNGESIVAKRLQELGFEVITKPRPPEMWAFCADPKKRYKILQSLRLYEIAFWETGNSDIRFGDRVAIWQAQDKEGRRGIVALGEVLGGPEFREDDYPDDPNWVHPEYGLKAAYRVPVRYVKVIEPPLWVKNPQYSDFLKNLSVYKAHGGTIFRIKPDEWEELIRISGGWPLPLPEEVEDTEYFRDLSMEIAGQGFGLNAAEKRAVENRAMDLAQEYFNEHWETVKDVSKERSFDLLCRTGDQELRVEVKGTMGEAKTVVLTKNEVREAEQSGYALFVVSQVILDRGAPGGARANGGVCWLFDPLDITRHELKPLAYTCELEWSLGRRISLYKS